VQPVVPGASSQAPRLVAARVALLPQAALAQAWDATKFFQYNIENIAVKPAGPGLWKVSPTAAVCSACHDKAEVKSHMVRTGGASFATTQAAIGTTVKERCANCHGPGQQEDVRRAHEIRGGSGVRSDEDSASAPTGDAGRRRGDGSIGAATGSGSGRHSRREGD